MDDADRIIDLYERYAADFDRERGRSLCERPWLDRFLSLIPKSGSVLDLGCGMGEPIARYVADQGFTVTGADSSPAMIAICERRFPTATWLVADMRRLALGQRFNGLLAWDSLFHLRPDDQRAMFPIFGAHAAPRAALLFTSGTSAGVAMGSYHGAPLYHASLNPEEYEDLLRANGFAVVAHVKEDAACGGHTIWLAQKA